MSSIPLLGAELIAQVEAGRTLTEAFAGVHARHPGLSPAERGQLQDIGYGCQRYLATLKCWLRVLVPRPLPAPEVEHLMLVALYQLGYTRAAPYAVVDNAVKAATTLARGGFKGLVNGVLRNFSRRRAELDAAVAANPEAASNHPNWWVKRLRGAYPAGWQQIVDTDNSHPPMTLRINHRHGDAASYRAELAELGLESRELGSHALQLLKPVAVRELPGFAEGRVSVQDWGAQQAALRLQLADGMRVLDACAAPGGKTGHMLELAELQLTALDVDAQRLKRVQDNLERLELSATLVAADAANPARWWDGQAFDRILADVPCSASGVVRRHPDIKWLRRPDDFATLATQQAAMLDALWGCLARGGKMLYATCSIFPEENARQLTEFLKRHADAHCEHDEQLLPCADHDGFYYALLAKA